MDSELRSPAADTSQSLVEAHALLVELNALVTEGQHVPNDLKASLAILRHRIRKLRCPLETTQGSQVAPVTPLGNVSLLDMADEALETLPRALIPHKSAESRHQSRQALADNRPLSARSVPDHIMHADFIDHRQEARTYSVAELLTYRNASHNDSSTKWPAISQEVFETTAAPESTPKVIWTFKFPFASKTLKRGDSYMTPQLLEINVYEQVIDGRWQIPRTIVICSTKPIMQYAIAKLERCVAQTALRRPDGDIGDGVAVVHGDMDLDDILCASMEFINKDKPLMVCSQRYAVDFLTADIAQVYWLNVKMAGMDGLLQAFGECERKLSQSTQVIMVFGEDDVEQGWHVRKWVERSGAETVTPLSELDKYFPGGPSCV